MAKVKRSEPLSGGSWDLGELGTVQHTSRWGTIARSKGSTLRYYPGCPWEKKPTPEPSPCEPGCYPPDYEHFLVLHMGYSGPIWGEPYGGILYLGLLPSTGGPIRWTILGDSSSFCPLGIEWEFRGVVREWLLVSWRAFGDCKEVSANSAIRMPGCGTSSVPQGYYEWPLPFVDPQDEWPGPTTSCLYAACYEWYPCGPTSGIVLP